MMTKEDILRAQQSWGDALIGVGQASDWAQAHALATQLVKDHYTLDGSLLFAPTRASEIQFRSTLEASVSYFVGKDDAFSEDHGFALEPWTAVRFENTGIQLHADVGIAMGNYFFTRTDGSEVKVEFTFAYRASDSGTLKIVAHHSALPFSA